MHAVIISSLVCRTVVDLDCQKKRGTEKFQLEPAARGMDERRCPIDGCEYLIPEGAMANPALTATHLSGHLMNHKGPEKDRSKVEAVKRPAISAAGTTQDWLYFMSRWGDYVQATKVQGAREGHPTVRMLLPGPKEGPPEEQWGCDFVGAAS